MELTGVPLSQSKDPVNRTMLSIERFWGVEDVEDPAGVGQGRLQVEAGGEALLGKAAGDVDVLAEDVGERAPLLPGGHGRPLHDAVGGVAVEAGGDEGEEDGLAEDQPVGAF